MLRELELEIQTLFPDEFDNGDDENEEPLPRLLDSLPRSLQKITMATGSFEEEVRLLFRDLPVEKTQLLPNLERFCYIGLQLPDYIKDDIKAAGVSTGRRKWPWKCQQVRFWEDNPLTVEAEW